MAKKPLQIDCIAGSQLRDTQGEMLSVEGADISELQAGKGRWNDNHGKGFFNSIGRITEAKKIFKAEDCDNDRHRYYWDKVKVPFIYASGYLYDDEDHPNARAAAAILRNLHKNDVPLQLKASVEGGVIARGVADKSLLARTKIHSVALTFTPANNNTLVEPTSLDKSNIDYASDLMLIKSVIHLAETNVPSFRHIVRDASASRVQENINKINHIMEQLGIENNISVPSKKQIIKKSIEQKIQDNVLKIREMVAALKKTSLIENEVLEKAADTNTLKAVYNPNIKPHQEDYKSYANKMTKSYSYTYEELYKGKKELLQMYKPEHLEAGKAHVEWANNLPKSNWKEWAVANHANDPNSFTDEHRELINHYAALNHPAVRDANLSRKISLEDGLNNLKAGEKTYVQSHAGKNHYVIPKDGTEKIIPTSEKRGWFNLNKPYDEDEGSALSHCGNVEGKTRTTDNILSLRDEVNLNKHKLHQPRLTFIENNGWLGEMKDRGNTKPDKQYHSDIVQLLKDPRIKGIAGGGYEHKSNFSFSDLSQGHQDEVLKANPNLITNLANISNPDDFNKALKSGLPDHHLKIVAENPNLHPDIQKEFVNHKDPGVIKALAGNPNLHLDIQKQLTNHPDPEVVQAMAEYSNLHPDIQKQLTNHPDPEVAKAMAKNRNLHPDIQKELVNHPDPEVAKAMAKNRNLHPDIQKELLQHENPEVVQDFLREGNPHPDIQKELLQHENPEVVRHFARNDNLHPDIQKELLQHENPEVVRHFARNDNLHPDIQKELANHPDPEVVQKLAENYNLHPDTQKILANHPDPEVVQELARQDNLYPETQKILANHPDPEVVQELARQDNLYPETQKIIANHPDPEVAKAMASNKGISVDIQKQLTNHPDPEVVQELARHRNLDPEVHKILANHPDPEVAKAMASNKGISVDIQKQLTNHPDPEVVKEMAKYSEKLHPDTQKIIANHPDPEVVKEMLHNTYLLQKLDPEVHKILANHPDPEVVQELMRYHDINPETQKILANHPDPEVVQELARQDNLDPETQKILANHPDSEVLKQLARQDDLDPEVHKILANHPDSEVVQELQEYHGNLDKSIKGNIAGAVLGASMLIHPHNIAENTSTPTSTKVHEEVHKPTHQEVYRQVAEEEPLLGAIGCIESNCGLNMNHKTIRNPASINYNHRAGGMFGMMPNTAAFTIKKDDALAEKYPDLADAAKDISNNHHIFTERFNSDPVAAADFAKSAFKRNSTRTASPEQLVYSWNGGLKGSWNTLRDKGHDAIKNHGYVKKVMNFYKKNTSKPQQNELLKALMAGYGGAGAPTSNVGGMVLQSESLDDGRVGFKHITCNNCGKEQIHSKFQVKCRHCGHGLSFEKLYEVMRGNK